MQNWCANMESSATRCRSSSWHSSPRCWCWRERSGPRAAIVWTRLKSPPWKAPPKKERTDVLAVITGASSGIGAAFARKLAARGYNLLLIARREDRLRSIADEIRSLHHVEAEPLAADLTLDADRDQVAARIRAAPDLALLVNNA